MNIFKKPTREKIVEDKITDIMHDLLTLDFTNSELATIFNSISEQGKSALQARKEILTDKLTETINAINSIR